jgi:hypothetical protein
VVPVNVELPDTLLDALAVRVAALMREQAPAAAADCWLDVDGAARHLGYDGDADKLKRGRARVYDLKARGELEFRKDGSRLLFRRSWLDAYLERSGR